VATAILEQRSPAIRDNRLVEPVGFETLGGVLTPVLKPCATPCETTEIFSTTTDNSDRLSSRDRRRACVAACPPLGQHRMARFTRSEMSVLPCRRSERILLTRRAAVFDGTCATSSATVGC
jgi:hypothetical protein